MFDENRLVSIVLVLLFVFLLNTKWSTGVPLASRLVRLAVGTPPVIDWPLGGACASPTLTQVLPVAHAQMSHSFFKFLDTLTYPNSGLGYFLGVAYQIDRALFMGGGGKRRCCFWPSSCHHFLFTTTKLLLILPDVLALQAKQNLLRRLLTPVLIKKFILSGMFQQLHQGT